VLHTEKMMLSDTAVPKLAHIQKWTEWVLEMCSTNTVCIFTTYSIGSFSFWHVYFRLL